MMVSGRVTFIIVRSFDRNRDGTRVRSINRAKKRRLRRIKEKQGKMTAFLIHSQFFEGWQMFQ